MPIAKTKNIILKYEGTLDYETIGILIGKLQVKVKSLNVKVFIYKKILTIMIESLENVYKYYIGKDMGDFPEDYHPVFHLLKLGNAFEILVSNPIKTADVQAIKDKIDRLNTLNNEELKQLYRDTITNGHFTDKGGAGLGFIEMAKISGKPIVYRFEKINEGFTIFHLAISLV